MTTTSAGNNQFPELYNELRSIAQRHLSRESQRALSTTELVHEAYLKLAPGASAGFQSENHALAVASRQMRRILVDHARARNAQKRGGNRIRIELHDAIAPTRDDAPDVLILEESLSRLEELNPKAASVVEMRFFAGMTEAQIAEHLKCSDRWVRKLWAFARAWLKKELAPGN